MTFVIPVAATASFAWPFAAQAQSMAEGQATAEGNVPTEAAPPPAITISGSASIASDYRFRGVSQTDRHMAVQGGITLSHESGFYAGTWASNLAGWGTFGGSNMELDLIGGFKTLLSDNAVLDVGLTSGCRLPATKFQRGPGRNR